LNRPILLHKNTKSSLQSFVSHHAQVPHLYSQWHYHKEIELLYVIRSTGTRFVGDSIQPFFDGDMVLVGSNVPHFWQNDEEFFQGKSDLFAEAILLQFEQDMLGEVFSLPEMRHINRLLDKASHGIQFTGTARDQAAFLLQCILQADNNNKILQLLNLLDLFARSTDYTLLSDLGYHRRLTDHSSERIQRVCNFILQHYRQPISLTEVAKVANMSEKAFCRFFKKSTQKTLVQFIAELRISLACKLLLSEDYSVGEVCYESGFNNLSNFNRVFKRITGKTPKAYQKAMVRGRDNATRPDR